MENDKVALVNTISMPNGRINIFAPMTKSTNEDVQNFHKRIAAIIVSK